MKLLVIDTCGENGSFALVDTERTGTPLELVKFEGRTASERLIPELRRAMSAGGWELGDLRAVGVVAGPGSFTGVRVGVAAAKGLCEAAGLRLIVISRLAVLALKAGISEGETHALLDAGRGEFFYGRFVGSRTSTAPSMEALLGKAAVLEAVPGEGQVAVCEDRVREEFSELTPMLTGAPDARDAVPLVIARAEAGAFDDVAESDANYLRRTELEVMARLAQRSAVQ